MIAPHLFVHCDDAICVAEDNAVVFFAPKTLKKFRAERFTGARLCGLHIQVSNDKKQNLLHVVDVEGNWCVLSLKPIIVQSSATICLQTNPMSSDSEVSGRPRIVSAERFGNSRSDGSFKGIQEAHFCQRKGQLHVILLGSHGVYEAALASHDVVSAVEIISFPTPMPDCFMAVGACTGLVAVAQVAQRWLQFSLPEDRVETGSSSPVRRRVLAIPIQSMACSPTNNSIALGGCRGELVVFPDARSPHFFSDHWHHTPLTAISFSVDGSALYTGAHESILLVWSTSYTHRKIPCNIGTIRCVVPSISTGSRLLLACDAATLATVDLMSMAVEASVEGIEWTSGEACSGLVVDKWMGQPAVIVTGLPNVLRICDPMTQQAVYSLHISSQQETVPMSPRRGIRHAGLLSDGRVLVTYESFRPTSLPPLLRFWAYDAKQKRHIESQTVYKPHDGVVALCVDKAKHRVFTLGRDTVKCWEEVVEDANDAIPTTHRSWRNQSTNPTPTLNVADMTLASDGTLCFLADDCVHVYAIAKCRVGEPWVKLRCLVQNVSTDPLHHLLLCETQRVVAAHHGKHLFLWDLAAPGESDVCCVTPSHAVITALCQFTPHSMLIACEDHTLVEVSCNPLNSLGKILGVIKSVLPSRILHMASLPNGGNSHGGRQQVAVVDDVSGFRVFNVSFPRRELAEEKFTENAARGSEVHKADEESKRTVHAYFQNGVGQQRALPETEGDIANSPTRVASHKRAGNWLKGVLQEPSYTVPSMASVLSLYLRRYNDVE